MDNIYNSLIKNLLDTLIKSGIRLIIALIILFVGFKLTKIIIKKIINGKGFKHIDISAQSFIKSFINIGLKVLIIILCASVLGVPMASLVAILGSIGLAIGLALQGGLSNVAGGVLLLLFKPFIVGDYIKTASGHEGTVIKIDIFYTTLRKADNTKIVVPNGELSNEAIYDVSHYDTRRVDLNFSTGYKDDVQGTIRILKDVAARHELVLDEPAPFAALTEHADSCLKYTLRVWTDKDNYWNVYYDLCAAVKEEFDSRGIEIPYPQMDIHIKDK